jgi:hypothetical protein
MNGSMTPTTTTSRAVELAPSATKTDDVTITRVVAGLGGLFLATVGIVTVIANQYREGQFWIPDGLGYIAAAVGVMLLVFLAIRDNDIEIRRVFGFFGVALLLTGVVVSLIPGSGAPSAEAVIGYRLMPWGLLAGFGGLIFLVPFVRNESDPNLKDVGVKILFGAGAGLSLLAVVLAMVNRQTLLLQAPVLAILGLGYLAGFFAEKKTEIGLGYMTGLGLGILGAVSLAVALGASIGPSVLFEGPSALKNANQSYDTWKLVGRIAMILIGLSALLAFRITSWPLWLRSSVAALGIAWAVLFLVATFTTTITVTPKPYFVPYGVILAAMGLVNLVVAVGLVSDSQFVVLTRRELAGYIYTPIGYIILIGMAAASAVGFAFFLDDMMGPQARAMEEPIVRRYPAFGIWAALQCLFLVPAITMRAFSEEKRSGTLEVLLTAPIGELTILLSKFAACWLFFMLSWIPAALYLIALRVVGGQPFDFKPLLSYNLAVGVCGAAFIAMGIFFSSLTKNQIVAAVLTSAWMFVNLLTNLVQYMRSDFFSPGLRTALGKLDFLTLWNQALGGSLPVADIFVQLSLGVFWIFLTAKVLEIRKWS